jgi:hypothetical protein
VTFGGPKKMRLDQQELARDGQCQRLSAAGCEKLFEEKLSGVNRNRPKLEKLIEQLREGDVLVVTRLDRLARSTSELLRIAERLTEKEWFRRGMSFDDLAQNLPRMLDEAPSKQRNVILHPHGPAVTFIQLDDLAPSMTAFLPR